MLSTYAMQKDSLLNVEKSYFKYFDSKLRSYNIPHLIYNFISFKEI